MSSSDEVKHGEVNIVSPAEPTDKLEKPQVELKLMNALPATVLFLLMWLLGGMFEKSLKDNHSKLVAIKLAPTNTENHETEEYKLSKAINTPTRVASEQLYDIIVSAETADNPASENKTQKNKTQKNKRYKNKIYENALLSQLPLNDKAQAIILLVKKLRENKHYESSLATIVNLTQQQQELWGLIFTKAYVLEKLGHTEAAVVNYKRLLILEPRNQAAFINLGLAYLSLQDYLNAESLFRLGIKHSNGIRKSKSYAGLATVQASTNNLQAALLSYQKAIEYRPGYDANWRKLGNVAELMGDHKLAKDSYQKAVSLEPNNLASRLEYADYLISRLDYLGAIKYLVKAKSIDRESLQVRLKLAFAYLHVRKPVNARKQLALAKRNIQQPHQKAISEAIQLYLTRNYLDAIKLLKASMNGRNNLDLENYLVAMCYVAVGRLKDSKKYLAKLTAQSHYYSAGQYLLAEAYIDNKRAEESKAVFKALLLHIDDNVKLFEQAAKAYQILGDYAQAVNLVDKALGIAVTKQLLLRKSVLHWLSGTRELAVVGLAKLVDEYPNYLRARYHLADYNHKMGNNAVAIATFSALLDIRSSYGDAQYQLGSVYFEQHQYEESLPFLSDYLLQKPDSKRTRMLYARAFCEIGQSQKCREQLNLVIKLSAKYEPALELLKKLQVNP